jgi:hypothetical protein
MSRHKTRIMYVERKEETLNGPARIGRAVFSKSGRSLTYEGRTFLRVGNGYKYNHIEEITGDRYWISGPRRDGCDRLYVSAATVEIDADVADEYWRDIRGA